MGQTNPEIIQEVEKGLEHRMSSVMSQQFENAGGVPTVAEILNVADRTTERTLLENLAQEDPDLVEEIRRLMFVFEDLTKFSDKDVQTVLKNVETSQWAMALKGASEELKQKCSATCRSGPPTCSARKWNISARSSSRPSSRRNSRSSTSSAAWKTPAKSRCKATSLGAVDSVGSRPHRLQHWAWNRAVEPQFRRRSAGNRPCADVSSNCCRRAFVLYWEIGGHAVRGQLERSSVGSIGLQKALQTVRAIETKLESKCLDPLHKKRRAAVFDPNLTLGQIEEMGMSCLRVVDGNVEVADGVVEFHGPVCHIRRFYRRFDFVVGACDGEQTNYLFVEYINTGSVHGWPASVKCLRRKGANV